MRKKQSKKSPLIPDPKFHDQLVTRFVNNLMLQGKKSTAYKVFYDAIDIVESKKGDEEKTSLELWKDALSNVMPHVEVRSRRVGGATFQIPSPIRPDRKISIAMKWLINASRKRNEKSMAVKLAQLTEQQQRPDGPLYRPTPTQQAPSQPGVVEQFGNMAKEKVIGDAVNTGSQALYDKGAAMLAA